MEVVGQVVRSAGDPGTDEEPQPRLIDGFQVAGGEHPGIRNHDHVRDLVTLLEGLGRQG